MGIEKETEMWSVGHTLRYSQAQGKSRDLSRRGLVPAHVGVMCSRRWSGTKGPRGRHQYHKTFALRLYTWQGNCHLDGTLFRRRAAGTPCLRAGGPGNRRQKRAPWGGWGSEIQGRTAE